MNIQHSSMMSSEQIYEDMCNKIEKLEYMPGDKLSENELCKVYGVTRHVIRNALAALKQRRLVDVYPQRGTFVSLIDMNYIEDILYMRESVEQEALYRVIKYKDRHRVAENMRKALKKQFAALDRGRVGIDKFYDLDNEFHQTMFDEIGRTNVMSLIAEHYIHIRRWRNFEIRSVERMQEIVTEHEKIIEAVDAGDIEKTKSLIHSHLDTVNRYSKDLKDREPEYFM